MKYIRRNSLLLFSTSFSPLVFKFANASASDLVQRTSSVISRSSSVSSRIPSSNSSSTWSPTSRRGLVDRIDRNNSRRILGRGLSRRGGSSGSSIGDISKYNQQINDANMTVASVLSSLEGGHPLLHSTCSVRGERQYMEDEFFVSEEGRFAAVFDGHGGAAVSRYLRQNLYANVQAALPTSATEKMDHSDPELETSNKVTPAATDVQSIVATALRTALSKVDHEVQGISHWSFQGSTALAVVVYENVVDGTRSIVSANIGDSRAVLSRNRTAVDLTHDHKPNNNMERRRVEALGGTVDWCGEINDQGQPVENMGVYRINGNLALSRAIGDRSERPWVNAEADLAHHQIEEDLDSFVILATDGLFDVMTSQDVISFIHETLEKTQPEHRQEVRKNIAKAVVEEALKRGTFDNITVLVLWINDED